MRFYLVCEYENGEQLEENIDDGTSLEDAEEIARAALEDAPITYIYSGYEDSKYGWQPALHLDYIVKFEADNRPPL